MTNEQLVANLIEICEKKTVIYGSGCIGWTLTKAIIEQKQKQYEKNKTFLKYPDDVGKCAADCSGMIVGAAYDGWTESTEPVWNAKHDWNDQLLHDRLTDTIDISGGKNTGKLIPGMCLWKKGHVGLYIGDGYTLDCDRDSSGNGIHKRKLTDVKWTLAGKLPEIEYIKQGGSSASSSAKKSNEEVAKEVIAGEWGVNPARKEKLEKAGYDYRAVQDIVNAMCNGTYKSDETKEENKTEKGRMLSLNRAPIYVSSTARIKANVLTGIYYISSSEVINNRIRVCKDKSKVGVMAWTTGWLPVEYL